MARHQHRRTVSDVFNIEMAGSDAQLCGSGGGAGLDQPIFAEVNKCSPSSSSSDFQSTSDSNFLLREDAAYRRRKELYYHRTAADGLGKQNQSVEQDDGDVLRDDEEEDEIREFAAAAVADDGDEAGQFETSAATSNDCSKATVSRVAVDVSVRRLIGGRWWLIPFRLFIFSHSFSQSFRRWSANFGRSIKNNKRSMYNKTIRFMPSRLQKSEYAIGYRSLCRGWGSFVGGNKECQG